MKQSAQERLDETAEALATAIAALACLTGDKETVATFWRILKRTEQACQENSAQWETYRLIRERVAELSEAMTEIEKERQS